MYRVFSSCFLAMLTLPLLTLALPQSLIADALIQSVEEEQIFDFGDTGTIGYAFRTNSAVEVFGLGMWDYQEDGFSSNVDVGLYNESGALLASVRLFRGVGSDLENGFRYETGFDPVRLRADTVYVLGAFRRPGVEYNIGMLAGDEFLVSSEFEIIEERADSWSGGAPVLAFPGIADYPNAALIGPNLKFRNVPEPGTAIVLITSALGLALVRRR